MSSNKFNIQQTPLDGLWVLERMPQLDSRGFFERFFCIGELASVIGSRTIKQVNRTLTKIQGTVRGLHFQVEPYKEMKLVSCLKGEVFDVAVDLRKESPTYGHWHSEILSETNCKTFVIPEGFAHGFQTLTDDVELIYLHTEIYSASSERGINVLDDDLKIPWPLPVIGQSDRDLHLPQLRGFRNEV